MEARALGGDNGKEATGRRGRGGSEWFRTNVCADSGEPEVIPHLEASPVAVM